MDILEPYERTISAAEVRACERMLDVLEVARWGSVRPDGEAATGTLAEGIALVLDYAEGYVRGIREQHARQTPDADLREQLEQLRRAYLAEGKRYLDAMDENARLREALETLARLGNGDHYGNSDGNMIARAALAARGGNGGD